jgi:ubiquitin carboxyl-terminal hydrolase 22/27/51
MCEHLSEYYSKYGVKSYQKVISNYSATTSGRIKRRRRALNIFCFSSSCGVQHSRKIFSCLHCIYFSCQNHLTEHYKNKKHYIGVNLDHGMLYCQICSDYIYENKFLKINEKAARSLNYQPWFPFPSDAELFCLKQHTKKVISENNKLGLRGNLEISIINFSPHFLSL